MFTIRARVVLNCLYFCGQGQGRACLHYLEMNCLYSPAQGQGLSVCLGDELPILTGLRANNPLLGGELPILA